MHNPFLGKCIHGRDGAEFISGRLTNRNCEHCTPDLKKPAKDWMAQDTVLIYDPDGWARSVDEIGKKPRWEDPITFEEYKAARDMSTLGPKHRRPHV